MTNVKVAGGGIIGMSIAWRLAQAGYGVQVHEAGQIGREASWAGAGMLAPGGEVEERSVWSDMAMESLRSYPAFVSELSEETGLRIDFRCCGAVERVFTEEEWVAVQARAERQRAIGIHSEAISDRELFFPADAVVNPRDVIRALRCACERRGVQLRENDPVESTDGSDVTVLAAGAWTSSIRTPRPIEPVMPVRGHLISYQMEPGSLGPILRSGHTYILERANGVTIAGSSTERVGFDRSVDQGIVGDIDSRARRLLPGLGNIVSSWSGFRPATESMTPQIGRLSGTNIFLAYGHYRNGILLAPATASRMVALIDASSERGSFFPPGDPQ